MRIFCLELTNDCNLRCPFCLRTHRMTRPTGYMDRDTFKQAIALILEEEEGPGRTTNLHNYGESLLHPCLTEYISYATERGVICALSTNGTYVDQETVYKLEEAGLAVLRISYDAAKASFCYRTRGQMILKAHAVLPDSDAPLEVYRKGLDDCAGLTGMGRKRPKVHCSFLGLYGWRVVLWDGTVVPCCMDINGDHIMGTVFDRQWQGVCAEWDLCEQCSGYVMNTALIAGNYESGESDL